MYKYSTNLTDIQWQVIEKIINAQERTRKHSLRDIMDAILYTGKTVYYYFRMRKLEGVFDDIMDTLHSLVRRLF